MKYDSRYAYQTAGIFAMMSAVPLAAWNIAGLWLGSGPTPQLQLNIIVGALAFGYLVGIFLTWGYDEGATGEHVRKLRAQVRAICYQAEIANHFVQDMRVMPAAGVADVLLEVDEVLNGVLEEL